MNNLSDGEKKNILEILKLRFDKNMNRHIDIVWKNVLNKLLVDSEKLYVLSKMEISGGEPDVIKYDKNNNEYTFCDCSKESPNGRRNVCYDSAALEARKTFKPSNNALDMAKEIGINILSEEEYIYLQQLGEFDLKTSSWLKTDIEIRKLGGAVFGDRRYNRNFIYHNGADSYYSVRGFRGSLRV